MKNSKKLFAKAIEIIPGGVNSPVRAFDSVNTPPMYIKKGEGAYIYDEDDNKYVDYCASWGPLILGHSHPAILDAVVKSSKNGLSFGTCNKYEIEMAELIVNQVSHIEMFRAVNSGTEATMSAIRLARGYTKRNKIIKFDGCYHGHADYLLVNAGSGLLTSGIASSAGVSAATVEEVIVVPYNNVEAVENVFAKFANEIAAIIVEPIAGNMGLIKPKDDFLQELRRITTQFNSLLIFDEVITGFRLAPTTYSDIIGVTPDLTCFGKIIGGGMPIGGFGGRKDIMKLLAPLGNVYQAGTLSGNPVALSAGIATLQTLINENPYKKLAKLATKIKMEVNNFAKSANKSLCCESEGGLFTIFFTNEQSLNNLDDVKKCDVAKFAEYHYFMVKNGIYISPSQFELGFVSTAHTEENINDFISAIKSFQ